MLVGQIGIVTSKCEGKKNKAVWKGAQLEQVQPKYDLLLGSSMYASGTKAWGTDDKLVLHAQVCTHKPLCRNGRARLDARVGIWPFCELCLGLTKRYRPDKVRHADKLHFTRYDTTMRGELNLTQYLSKTNAPFLVGNVNLMTGCNTLVSMHLQSGSHTEQEEDASFTYVSHSIKEFFDNVQKVPEKFIHASAYHLCMDPQVQWVGPVGHPATVHDHPDLFKAQHGSGPDALAKEIIANVTHSYVNDVYLFVGEPISAGYEQCDTARLDWEQDTNA